jgi:hypothetical protein
MKRFGVMLASAFLASIIAGCTGPGIEEGMGKGEPGADFKNLLETQGKMMQTSGAGEKKAAAKLKELGGTEKPKTGP